MSARPPISQAVYELREYYLEQGIRLSDLMFRLTISDDGTFEVVRVEQSGLIVHFRNHEGRLTIDDPIASNSPGVYYLRPDKFGKFTWIGPDKTEFLHMTQEYHRLPDSQKVLNLLHFLYGRDPAINQPPEITA
ncbi:MAG: hypothetical protein PHN19_03570 [Patescibacteria group bacterium]|nr:hypothetical protein [Patescibacteria group bacterium]